MSENLMKLAVCILLTAVCAVQGSDFTVKYIPDSNTAVIFVEAEDFDSKTPEFVEDPDIEYASGSAYYFPGNSPVSTQDNWYAEYSIDSAMITDPNVSAADLDGKSWYCWARVNQPGSDAQEADWILVKGDPNDGIGDTWFADALSTVDNADDRIANDIAGAGGDGFGAWAWIGEAGAGVEKEFNLDDDGKIVFRIYEREGGSSNARIDAICFANNASFTAADVQFGTPSTADLDFEMNAAHAGKKVLTNWVPYIGGIYKEFATGDFTAGNDSIPDLKVDFNSVTGKYTWYYEFDGNDVVENIYPVDQLSFDSQLKASEPVTLEVWLRVWKAQTGSAGRGTPVSSCDGGGTGWALRVRDRNPEWQPYIQIRDNETALTPAKGLVRTYPGSASWPEYSETEWHQLTISLLGVQVEYDDFQGVYTAKAYYNFWVDGVQYQSNSDKTFVMYTDAVTDPAEFTFFHGTSEARLGVKQPLWHDIGNMMPFTGDISVVRIYDRELTTEDVLANYNYGIDTDVEYQCAGVEDDLNDDCIVDLVDVAEVIENWLDSAVFDGNAM